MPCAVAKSLYCGRCASFGHSPGSCPRKPVEQPVADGLLPLDSVDRQLYPGELAPNHEVGDFSIANDETAIRAALVANDATPMICQEKGKRELKEYRENKRRLAELVASRGRRLVLVGPAV